jgi:hypothetical protein
MSTLAYSALTNKRVEAEPGTSDAESPPGMGSYVDALTALVPAEVLAAQAAIIPLTTTTTQDADGQNVSTITEPGTLKGVFAALIVLSIGLYVAGRWSARASGEPWWTRLDYARVLIPPLAYVGWTMLQKTTAFDAVLPDVAEAPRYAIAIIGAVVLGAAATLLAYKADQTPPPPAPEPPAPPAPPAPGA